MKSRRREIIEARTTTVDTGDLRMAISSMAHVANVAAEALKEGQQSERDRSRAVITHCTGALTALAFALIPKEARR